MAALYASGIRFNHVILDSDRPDYKTTDTYGSLADAVVGLRTLLGSRAPDLPQLSARSGMPAGVAGTDWTYGSVRMWFYRELWPETKPSNAGFRVVRMT